MNLYEELIARNQENLSKAAACVIRSSGNMETLTYQDMIDGIDRYYEILRESGDYVTGDRIGICGKASPDWHLAFFAIAKMGCTAACIDHTYSTEEMHKIVAKAKLRGLYVTDDTMKTLGGPIDGINIYDLSEGSIIHQSKRSEAEQVMTEDADILIFSSGTTSTAAGILHTFENAVASITMILHANYVDNDKQRFMAFLPNSHIYGCYAQCIAPMLFGCSVCYMEELNAGSIHKAFEEFSPTIFCGVPKVYELLMASINKKIESSKAATFLFDTLFPICLKIRKNTGINLGKYIFASVKKGLGGGADVMLCGGAPLLRETGEFLYGVGLRPIITYGATETSIPTLGNYGENITMDTCGKAYPVVKTRFSEAGELQLITPYQMIGYFDEPERDAEAYTEDGWFKTGDLAALDEKGNVVIQGRLKENIVLATGKKVAPDDIEKNYIDIPGVKDYAVCGIPAGEDGSYDEVHCFAVLESGAEADSVKAALLAKSSESPLIMKLHQVNIVSEIPRTALGKPKRFRLAKMIDQIEAKVDPEQIKEEANIEQIVIETVKKITGIADFDISAKLFDDLALDSLSAIELCVELEAKTGVKVEEYSNKNSTVEDLINLCTNPPAPKKDGMKDKYPLPHKWLDYHIMKLAQKIIKLLYKVRVVGEDNIPDDSGYILCANHVTYFDYLFMTSGFSKNRYGKLGCMAKKELFTGSVISRTLCRIGGMFPVDRGGFVADTMNMIMEKFNENWGLIAFPEGTRSSDGKLAELKHGITMLAVNAGVPIVPAYIKGGYDVYSRHSKLPKLFNIKTFHRYHVQVEYGKPIYPDGRSVEELTAKLREEIEMLS